MSQQPCRQLNSVAIKDEVLASIIPLVRNAFSVIGVKCTWRVKGGENGIQSAWRQIVNKRNECDAVVSKIPGVGFYFSAISTYQSTKRDKNSTPEDHPIENSDDDCSDVESSQIMFNSAEVTKLTHFYFFARCIYIFKVCSQKDLNNHCLNEQETTKI